MSSEHKSQNFHFPKLENSDRLSYDKLNEENASQILEMFSRDSNEFIIPEFKEKALWKNYIDWQLNVAPFSRKHGAQDWLIRIKNSNKYIGLLNLYELSLETFMGNNKRCFVGVAIKPSQRRKYFASESISNLINYANKKMRQHTIVARTEHENIIAQKMLAVLEFKDSTEKYWAEYKYFEKMIPV